MVPRAAAILWGSWTAWSNGLKPLATIDLGGRRYAFYLGLGALILNVAVAAIMSAVLSRGLPRPPQRYCSILILPALAISVQRAISEAKMFANSSDELPTDSMPSGFRRA